NLIGEEREKERVSYELHDSISASLTALRMKIESLVIEKELLIPITSNLEAIQHETRKISHNLLPFQGGSSHFVTSLENYCSENSTTSFQIKFYSSIQQITISDIKAKTLYRIIQEMVNNAMKHSQSSVCYVSLNANSELLNILVEDQGIGLKEGTKNGQGLLSIAKRVANIDGNIEISSFENKGTSILIEVPI
ncbi:MAG: sensor histidine kinase, partial [Fluviicola sp.]